MTCTHLDQIGLDLPDEDRKRGALCPECLAAGSRWVHLRICRSCGHVGCCDSSPNRHARAHWRGSGHPLIASLEPGERWSYCFVDDEFL